MKNKKLSIRRSTLEKSLQYLACPADQSELELNVPNSDQVQDGEFRCKICGTNYEIRQGVPYFFENANGFEWDTNIGVDGISRSISDTLQDQDLTWSKILSLSNLFINRLGDRKKSIDSIFGIVESIAQSGGIEDKMQAYLIQAATAARYDLEVYRGTFLLPDEAMRYLINWSSKGKGIVFEGACATGECLRDVSKAVESDFYLGLDISGSMVRNAQAKSKRNMLFVQGDLCSLPLKRNSVGLAILNNVFDRVRDPYQVCSEINRSCGRWSNFALSNCVPLQYEYRTDNGDLINFVPVDKQIDLDAGIQFAGFYKVLGPIKGIWSIDTVAYGKEKLPFETLVGWRG